MLGSKVSCRLIERSASDGGVASQFAIDDAPIGRMPPVAHLGDRLFQSLELAVLIGERRVLGAVDSLGDRVTDLRVEQL